MAAHLCVSMATLSVMVMMICAAQAEGSGGNLISGSSGSKIRHTSRNPFTLAAERSAKHTPEPKPSPEPKLEHTTEPRTEHTPESTSEPRTEHTPESTPEPRTEHAPESTTEPRTELKAEPTAEPRVHTTTEPKISPPYLTDYLDADRYEDAQRHSLVHDPCTDCKTTIPKSYAGFLTVNKTNLVHQFFWYFPTEDTSCPNASKPLLVWLNGGPGASSLLGLFVENGPLKLSADSGQFERRNGSWTSQFSMLYIDMPAGVGFSFAQRGGGVRNTPEQYSHDLVEFLVQFYKLFPKQMHGELYIGGQAYAAKYIIAASHRLHGDITDRTSRIPLRGIYIGGPLFAPEVQFPAAYDYHYHLGAFGKKQYEQLRDQTSETMALYTSGEINGTQAFVIVGKLLFTLNLTGRDNYYTGQDNDKKAVTAIVNSKRVRDALHMDSRFSYAADNDTYFTSFMEDFVSSAKDELGQLLDSGRYKILIYNGDMDAWVNPNMVEAGLLATDWCHKDDYINANRIEWWKRGAKGTDKKTLYGWYSRVGKLCRVTLYKAGTFAPRDRPEASLEMIKSFIEYGCIV